MIQKQQDFRNDILKLLTVPGGCIGLLSSSQRQTLENIEDGLKDVLQEDCHKIVAKKLMEMDTLIIESATHNICCASKNMCGVNFPLVKYARDLLAIQKQEFDRIMNRGNKPREPFDLSFLGNEAQNIIDTNDERFQGTEEQQQEVWRTKEERDNRIMALHEEGYSYSVIAEKFGMTKGAISKIINKN